MPHLKEIAMADHVEAVLSKFQLIPVEKIKPSKYQARKQFSEVSLHDLAESIRAEGLLEPIVVRQIGEEFELISGERRLRACKLNGAEKIEAKIIETVSEAEAAAKGLIENLQREDLNPIEEAEGFQQLLDMKDSHWTQEQIGKMVGKPQSRISESIRLLSLPKDVQENIRQRIITREHGIELMRIDNTNSLKSMANKVLIGGWSVKKTREMIDKKLGKVPSPGPACRQAGPDEGDPDPLAAVWAIMKMSGGIAGVEYRGNLVWRVEVSPQGVDLGHPTSSAYKENLQTGLAEALISAGQTLQEVSG
jgi:ParB family chromosome partitioning protein